MKLSIGSEWGDMDFDFSDQLHMNGYPSLTFDFLCATDWDLVAKQVEDGRDRIITAYSSYQKRRIDFDHFISQLRSVFPENFFFRYGRYCDELLISILEADEFSSLIGENLAILRQGKSGDSNTLKEQPKNKSASPKSISRAVSFLEDNLVLNNDEIYVFPFKAQNAPLLFTSKTFRLLSGKQEKQSSEAIMVQVLTYVFDYLILDQDFNSYVSSHVGLLDPSQTLTPFEAKSYTHHLLRELGKLVRTWNYPSDELEEEFFQSALYLLCSILNQWVDEEKERKSDKFETIRWVAQCCTAAQELVSFADYQRSGHGPVCQLQTDAIASVRQNMIWTYEVTSIVELLFLMTSLSGRITPKEANVLRPCSCCKRPTLSAAKESHCMRTFVDPITGEKRKDSASCLKVFFEKEDMDRLKEMNAERLTENRNRIVDLHRQYNENYRKKRKRIIAKLGNNDSDIETKEEHLLEYAYLCLYDHVFREVYRLFLRNNCFPPASPEQNAEANFQDWHKRLSKFKKSECREVLKDSFEKEPEISLDLIYPTFFQNTKIQNSPRTCIWNYRHYTFAWPKAVFEIIRDDRNPKTPSKQSLIEAEMRRIGIITEAINSLKKDLCEQNGQ